MDHSENDKRFCVYVLKDKDGNVVYVGHGNKYRPFIKKRNNPHLAKIIDEVYPEIVHESLSKNEALALEIETYDLYKPLGKLLNKNRPAKVHPILFENISKFVYYDETSPTFLRWKIDIRAGVGNNLIVVRENSPAGTIKRCGYVETRICKVTYKNHRLIWSLCNKEDLISNLVVDHIDGNPSNNSISNLRLVSQKENMSVMKNYKVANTGHESIVVLEDRHVVIVRWMDGFIRKSKTFNYKSLFNYLDIELAKEKCIELAVWYREQVLNNLEKEKYSGI